MPLDYKETSATINHNYLFGLTMDMDFYQPENGEVDTPSSNAKESMRFEFSGDDDVAVFVDGVLVLDLMGVHQSLTGKINFKDGKVTVPYSMYDVNQSTYSGSLPTYKQVDKTLYLDYIYKNAGKYNDHT